ncbi:DUF4279 domain-containing protein [Planococcus sp. N028]|uniref:DUF4279 domain-containing protein n=1 Tax=Planococcus shixiaomingii TaxID=3058393 RepID=A0ABT8MYP9_9BACL|nr:DUF4279 domain-containing protein [Planococcus sp. N028]MDN7240756.1 DUF4279 domain-containing protein [Planococcus sp. N028]
MFETKSEVMVRFSLFGDEFPIDFVTEQLGIEPTATYKKEEILAKADKGFRTRYRKESCWELSSGYQTSFDAGEQMNQVLEPLKSKTALINNLKAQFNLDCKIFVVIVIKKWRHSSVWSGFSTSGIRLSCRAEFDTDLYAWTYEEEDTHL